MIFFTRDGKDPTSMSKLYTAPVLATDLGEQGTQTVKAIAMKHGMVQSSIVVHTVVRVSTPVIGRTGEHNDKVTITSPTDGASIYFAINTELDGATRTRYVSPADLDVSSSGPIKITAVAEKDGMTTSEVAVATFSVGQVEAPSFAATPPSAFGEISVELVSSTSDAKIRYTTDGTTPTSTNGTVGTRYTLRSDAAKKITVRAIAVQPGMAPSTVTSHVMSLQQVEAPSIAATPPSAFGEISVELMSLTSDAKIRYTTDGTTPTLTNGTVGTRYTLRSDAAKRNMVIRIVARRVGMIDSVIVVHTMQLARVEQVTSSKTNVDRAVHIALDCATEEATIFYTRDGTTPTSASASYTSDSGLKVDGSDAPIVLSAVAMRRGMASSVLFQDDVRRVDKPQIVLGGSNKDNAIITTASGGATIHFSVDNTGLEDLYTGPVSLDSSSPERHTVHAVGSKHGMVPSEIATADFTFERAEVPTFTEVRSADGEIEVSMTSATKGASISYTKDGSTPTRSNGIAGKNCKLKSANPAEVTVRAIAHRAGLSVSQVGSHLLKLEKVAPLVTKKSYSRCVEVSFECPTDGATIFFTRDGSQPSNRSTPYEFPVLIAPSEVPSFKVPMFIKAVALRLGMLPSDIGEMRVTNEDGRKVLGAVSRISSHAYEVNDHGQQTVEKIEGEEELGMTQPQLWLRRQRIEKRRDDNTQDLKMLLASGRRPSLLETNRLNHVERERVDSAGGAMRDREAELLSQRRARQNEADKLKQREMAKSRREAEMDAEKERVDREARLKREAAEKQQCDAAEKKKQKRDAMMASESGRSALRLSALSALP